MNNFIRRAFDKIEKLSTEEIKTLVRYQAGENELLGIVLQQLNTGIIVTNRNGRVLTCNDSAKRLMPQQRSMSEGSTLRYVIKDSSIAEFIEEAIQTMEMDESQEQEFYIQRGESVCTILIRCIMFESSFEPMTVSDSRHRFVFIINDISEERRKDAQLHRSESLASLTTVAAGVAHEIKNPLASIGIHLQLLRKAFEKKRELTAESAARYLDVIDEEIERLNSIVVDFLFAVRPMDVRLRLESVNRILTDVISFVSYELSEYGIHVETDLAEYLPKLRIDENLFKQVILNIVKNAMHAMEDNGGSLSFKTRNNGDSIDILISDTGIGMDESTQNKIFEPYFTTKASGSGLGLTVVFKVMKEHGGDISVQSTVGKGTTFILSLPVPRSQRLALESKDDV